MAIDSVKKMTPNKLYDVMFWPFAIFMFGIMPAAAKQFGSSVLASHSSSCVDDRPIITSVKAMPHHAYVGMAYRGDGSWRGALLKYRMAQGAMVSTDGKLIYENNQARVRPDIWAVGKLVQGFGTQGQLNQSAGRHLWVLKDKNGRRDGDLVKLTDATDDHLRQLVDYTDDELAKIKNALNNDGIGAVMYPPSTDDKSGVLIYTDTKGVLRLIDGNTSRQLMAYLSLPDFDDRDGGIDAAWRLYRVRVDGGQNWQDKLIAVGGFGRSNKGLMALDVTDANHPKMLYRLTESELPDLSHIHAPISLGYIRQAGKQMAVFVFGGGSDTCYQDGTACNKSIAEGAVVYAINAWTGQKVQRWVGGSEYAKHSFAGEVTLIDRQGDGVFEHIYAADLGGQIFRFDVHTGGVSRVFAANDGLLAFSTNLFASNHQRFYQKPIVSLYDSRDYPLYPNRNRRFALISIASNDQLPDVNGKMNHVYGIFDDGLIDLNSRPTITPSDLINIDDKTQNPAYWLGSVARAKGWMRVLNIDGDTNVTLMNGGVVVPSGRHFARRGVRALYHLSVAKVPQCLHDMTVQSQGFCLPFGVCAHHKTGQLLTNNANTTILNTPTIRGNWLTTATKSSDGNSLAWQILMPSANVLNTQLMNGGVSGQGDDAGKSNFDVSIVRNLRFLRWYDVRSTGN